MFLYLRRIFTEQRDVAYRIELSLVCFFVFFVFNFRELSRQLLADIEGFLVFFFSRIDMVFVYFSDGLLTTTEVEI